MTKTNNYNWDLPEDGESGWGLTLNDAIKAVDSDLNTVEEKATAHVAKLTTSDSSTDINSSGTVFPWDNAPILDSAYSFDGTAHELTIESDGLYEFRSTIAHYSDTNNARENPGSHITVNGTKTGGFGRSGYTRNASGHNHASTHAEALEQLVAGDTVTVTMEVNGNTGVSTPTPAGCVFIAKKIR